MASIDRGQITGDEGLALLGEPVWVHGAFGWGGGTDCGVCISRDIHGLQLVAMSKLAVRAVKLWLL